MKVLVLGATGKTGRLIVAQGAAHALTALARSPAALPAGVTAVQGDATDAAAVERAVQGQDAVISALGRPDFRPTTMLSDAAKACVAAMEKHRVKRLVYLSAFGVGDSRARVGFLSDKVFIPLIVRNIVLDHERAEAIVRASALDWIIVRPSHLVDTPARAQFRHGDIAADFTKKVSRADVAAFMLQQLTDDTYLKRAPGISY